MATILVVDDDPASLELVELALEPGGHRAVLCDRGELALDLALGERADAVVLDIMMPGMTGFEVLHALQGNLCTRGIPVLILSALGDASDRVRGLREGAKDYLVKPFDVDELLLRVHNLLAQRSRPGALLEGNLSCLHMADILQQMVDGRASGLLEIRSADASGQVTLSRGKLTAATCGPLSGREALLALIEADKGEFSLLAGGDGHPHPVPELSHYEVLMEVAWLTDQTERLRTSLPGRDAVLHATRDRLPPVPADLTRARIPEVFEALRGAPCMTLAELEEKVRAAPRRLALAVAWLIRAQVVSATAARTEMAVETLPGPPATPGASNLDAAIDHVVGSAVERGFPSDVVHLLLAAQPEHWESLGALFQRLPHANALLDAGSFVARVQERGAESLRLVHRDGTLLVHVHVLYEMSVARAETILPMCSGVALWVGAPDSAPESALLMDSVKSSHARITGVLIPATPALQAAWREVIEQPQQWSIAAEPPGSFVEALRLF